MIDNLIQPYTNIPLIVTPPESSNNQGGNFLGDVREINVGEGSNVFRVNKQGLWLGANKFADAPFSVDMTGHVIANSIALTGFVPTGGSAADINNNTTLINGGKIVTGSINASSMVVGSLRQVFTSTPTTPYAVGDLWSQGSSGDLKRCITARTSGAYNAADWDLASKYTDDSNTTTIIGNTVTTSYLNAKNITAAGMVTGALIQTESGTYAGAKMSSALNGIVVYGQNFEVRDTANTLYGSIGGYAGYFNISAVGGRNMLIGATNATVFFANDVGTTQAGGGLLGSSGSPWNTIYGGNLVSNNLYAAGSASYLRYFSSTWNFQHKAKAPEFVSQFAHIDNIVLANNSPLNENGSIYFDGTHFYGRIAGVYKQLDN